MGLNCLRELIAEAKGKLQESGHTKADKAALIDVIKMAENVLDGEKHSFTRNREIFSPDRDQEADIVSQHYTMVPSYFEEGRPSVYGLKPAMEWFERQNQNHWSKAKRQEVKESILDQSKSLLDQSICGSEVGQYSLMYREKLVKECARLLQNDDALIDCMDALYDYRLSRVHASDQNSNAVLLINDPEELRRKIQTDAYALDEYKKIQKEADEETLAAAKMAYEQIWESHSFEELSKVFEMKGDCGKNVNLITPLKTCKARMILKLPSIENEQDGLGHIYVWGFQLKSAAGPAATLPNENWQFINESKKIEKEQTSIFYLCNPTSVAEASIVSPTFPVAENSGYTLFFQAQQEKKFKKGLQVIVEFLDCHDQKIGEFVFDYNRKSVPPILKKALWMQCSAIVYQVGKDKRYAKKAVYQLLTFLNDFCQGAEYWLTFNERPEGSDAYGAVQAGRILCTAASTYSMVVDTMNPDEISQFYLMADYLLHYCMDLRNRTWMSAEEVQRGSGNWQTDMCIGVILLMIVLPDYPDRKKWMYNAWAVLKAQLAVNLNKDGSWPESIRYHFATLQHFASFAAVWKRETGEDWYQTTGLKKMFDYPIHTITPPYTFFDKHISTPPFGDHKLSGGEEFAIYGLCAPVVAQSDLSLAKQMLTVWELSGKPIKALDRESLAIENLLYIDDAFIQKLADIPKKSIQKSNNSGEKKDSGIYIFRDRNDELTNYLAVMATEKKIGHGHLDAGSFILYQNKVPVVMDTGIEGYFDTSTQWHLSSYSHACVQFAATVQDQMQANRNKRPINLDAGSYSLDRGWLDTPPFCHFVSVEENRIRMEIDHPKGRDHGIHIREIEFFPENGSVHIVDRVKIYTGKLLFSLPLVGNDIQIQENQIGMKRVDGMRSEITIQSQFETIKLDSGRTTPIMPDSNNPPMLPFLRIVASAKEGFDVWIR